MAQSACDPACTGAQLCSKAGVCVDPGHCAHPKDCLTGEICDLPSRKCVVDEQCGAQQLTAEPVPPNLLVVLDRSYSMTSSVNGVTRWQIAIDLMNWMTLNYDHHFGLALFPDDQDGDVCKQGDISVSPAEGTGSQIRALLAAASKMGDVNYPNGIDSATNISAAMEQAAGAPELTDDSRDNAILLITDGRQENCTVQGNRGREPGGHLDEEQAKEANAHTYTIIKDLRNLYNVTTFVLGFGAGVDAQELSRFAVLGGRPVANQRGDNLFYHVENRQSFQEALGTIALRSKLSCSYTLDEAPPELNEIHAYFDGHEVPRDPSHVDGWDLDTASRHLAFYGAACRDLELNRVAKLDVVYGCRRPGEGGVVGDCKEGEQPCSAPRECPEDHACLQGCCRPLIL